MPQVFFSRCKPLGIDAVDVALKSRRLFFGYGMWNRQVRAEPSRYYDRHNMRSCIVDLTCDDATWEVERAASDKRPQYNQNRNFVRKIDPGSIALVPRPSRGVIYAGYVEGGFELVDDPAWYDIWERIWRENKKEDPDANWIATEIVQTWKVDKFREIPVPRVPVWIRRSLFGRQTYGLVGSYGGLDPHATMREILESDGFVPKAWTTDPKEIERRLVTDVTPGAFEHLVVSLLQLEHPDEVWTHEGGSGDGGLDGLGADASGQVVGLLQCKWAYWGEPPQLNTQWASDNQQPRAILAAACHDDDQKAPDGFEFFDKRKIAELLVKHAASLPQAKALRICSPH